MTDLNILSLKLTVMEEGILEIKKTVREILGTVIKVPVIEERQSTIKEKIEGQLFSMQQMEKRIADLEIKNTSTIRVVGWAYDAVKWGSVLLATVGAKKIGLF